MTATPAPAATTRTAVDPARVRGLRIATLAGLLMLTVQYGFGIWAGHAAALPSGARGGGILAGFARAVAAGPVGLSAHAVLGALLLITAISVLVRAGLAHRPAAVGLALLGLAAILAAALAGADFIGHPGGTASLIMALSTGLAIGTYTILLFTIPTPPPPRDHNSIRLTKG